MRVSREEGVERPPKLAGDYVLYADVSHEKGVESCISTAHPPPDFGHGFP